MRKIRDKRIDSLERHLEKLHNNEAVAEPAYPPHPPGRLSGVLKC